MTRKGAPKRKAKTKSEAPAEARALAYKVVELSQVDEHSLERALNEWVARGWTFEGVQFAMRESSRRPAMGFVIFTRDSTLSDGVRRDADAARPADAAEQSTPTSMSDAWARLAALAEAEE